MTMEEKTVLRMSVKAYGDPAETAESFPDRKTAVSELIKRTCREAAFSGNAGGTGIVFGRLPGTDASAFSGNVSFRTV